MKDSEFRPHRFLSWVRTLVVGDHAAEPRKLGLYGEDLACRELERRGYRIVGRRVRSRLGEIDIVAWDGPVLVFVEVKTRRGDRFGRPVEAVDPRKQKKIIMLARSYVARKRLRGVPVRFDIIGVEIGSERRPRIELIQGAFQAQ